MCLFDIFKINKIQIVKDCPLPFGFYRLGNASVCNEYMHCHYGRPYNYSCPLGLAFNPATHQVRKNQKTFQINEFLRSSEKKEIERQFDNFSAIGLIW